MTATYELKNDTPEQMTLAEPRVEEEAGLEEEQEQQEEEEEEEEVGQEETGVELAVAGEDWELMKAHCAFAGIKQRYQLALAILLLWRISRSRLSHN